MEAVAIADTQALPRPDLGHIPGPAALPLIGQTLSFVRNPYGVYETNLARFGPVYQMSVFGFDWVVLAGPDALQEVYLDRDKVFSAKLGLTAFARMFSGGLLQRDFDDHRAHRRVMQAAFKAPVVRAYLDRLNTEMAQALEAWPTDARMQMAPALKEVMLGTGASVFMGLTDPDEVARMNALFLDIVQSSTALIRAPLPLTKMGRGVKARAALGAAFRAMIAKRRETGGDDFFSQLCLAKDDDGTTWTEDEIVDHFNFLLVAAHDATTGALTTMMWAMGLYPQWQDRMADEVAALPPGPLKWDDLDRLPVTQMVYQEALRMFAPSAFTARAAVRDTRVLGHDIPAGTRVVLCPGPVMMSPELWTDPQTFDPERFSPQRAEDKQHKYAWSPFGGGAHKCIGLHFAGLQVKSFMVEFLRRYRLTLARADHPRWQQLPTPKPHNNLPVTLTRV